MSSRRELARQAMTDNTDRTRSGSTPTSPRRCAYVLGWITGVRVAAHRAAEPVRPLPRAAVDRSCSAALSLAWFLCLSIPLLGWLISFFLIPPVSAVLWLLLMFKAYQGERFKLPIAATSPSSDLS